MEDSSGNQHILETRRRDSSTSTILDRDYLSVGPLIEWLKTVASQYAAGTLVDWGCGNKPYQRFFWNRIDKYIGIDITQNASNTVDVVVPMDEALPFDDGSIDTVLSTQVLEHVSEPEVYLREVSRILRPGGHLILSCPGSYMLHEEPNDFYRYTRYGLTHLLSKCSLCVVRIDTCGGAWRLLGQVFLNHRVFGRKFRIPVLTDIAYYFWNVTTNILCSAFDAFNANAKDTVGYMLIARK